MAACLELSITAEPVTALADASQQLRNYLGQHRVGKRALYAAELAIEELGTNILSYGVTTSFVLRATVKPELVELVFEDSGIAFDPSVTPTPKRSKSLEEVTIGGLGIHMVRQVAKRMTYLRAQDRNRLEVEIARD